MDASRVWTLARERGDQAEIYLNVLPGRTFEQAKHWFIMQASESPRVCGEPLRSSCLNGLPKQCVRRLVATHSGRRHKCREANGTGCLRLTRLALPVTGDRGWNALRR